MDETIAKVISDLRNKQRELREKADKIETTIISLRDLFNDQLTLPEIGGAVESPVSAPRPTHPAVSIGQASVEVLRMARSPLKTREIANALESQGFLSSDMYRAVFNALDSLEEVVKAEGKRWALKEWQE